MKSDRVLLLGNPLLHRKARPVQAAELPDIQPIIQDLHDILFEFKEQYGAFRAIAAPQIGEPIRLIYLHIDHPTVIINPVLQNLSREMFEIWDDCMCFPNLLVQVKRHRRCTLEYYDEDFQPQSWDLEEELAELLQHECDHLDGILATQRAISLNHFKWRA